MNLNTPILSSELSHKNNCLIIKAENLLNESVCLEKVEIDYDSNFSEEDTSSDFDFCYSNEDYVDRKDNPTLSQDLAVIVSKYNLPRLCTNELLAMLRKHGHIIPKRCSYLT